MTELLIHENYFLEQLELEHRSYEAFVFDWLQNTDWSPNFLDRAKTLGIDLYKKNNLFCSLSIEMTRCFSVRFGNMYAIY